MTLIRSNSGSQQAWGARSQIGATLQELKDVKGNKDGLWGNETQRAGTTGDLLDRQPLAAKIKQFTDVGLSTRDEVAQLKAFRAERELAWGQPVTNVDLGRLRGGELFAAQKAIALTRLGRTPADVTDGFVKASGSVDGKPIADREIFYQRFRPVGEPSGKVVVVSPGFQETGRNFYEQIAELNKQGHDVMVMDHQWAGQSGGKAGGLDRGFGVARDVAAVAAEANKVMEQDYGSKAGKQVVLFGNSMGAGPGVLGALTMNDAGLIKLNGPQMPKGLSAVVQAPFLGATPSATNKVLGFASGLPLLNKLAAPSAGVPVLTHDKVAAQKGAQGAVLEDVRAQLSAMGAAEGDLARMRGLWDAGQTPSGKVFIVHGDQDPLADPAQSRALAQKLGSNATLQMIHSNNHVLEQSPGEQGVAIGGLQTVLE